MRLPSKKPDSVAWSRICFWPSYHIRTQSIALSQSMTPFIFGLNADRPFLQNSTYFKARCPDVITPSRKIFLFGKWYFVNERCNTRSTYLIELSEKYQSIGTPVLTV